MLTGVKALALGFGLKDDAFTFKRADGELGAFNGADDVDDGALGPLGAPPFVAFPVPAD